MPTTPTPDRNYHIDQTERVELSREVWNSVVGSIGRRLQVVEQQAGSVVSMRDEILDQSIGYIQAQVSGRLVKLQESIQVAQSQIDVIVVDGLSPDSQKLGGHLPSYFATAQGLIDGLAKRVPVERKVAGKPLSADVTVTAADIGLGRVNNTSDADKPVSAAQRAEFDRLRYARAVAAGAGNILVNSNFQIAQEGDAVQTNGRYFCDQWQVWGDGPNSAARSTDVPGGFVRAGKLSMTAVPNGTTGEVNALRQKVERHRFQHLGWGLGRAVPATFFLWMKASKAGRYSLRIDNNSSRTFLAPLEIEAADAWQFLSVQIPPPPVEDGWEGSVRDHAMNVFISAHSGSGQVGVEGWQLGGAYALPGQVDYSDRADHHFSLAGTVFFAGGHSIPSELSLVAMRPFSDDLLDCIRYFWQGETSDGGGHGFLSVAPGQVLNGRGPAHSFRVPMRVRPSMSIVTAPQYTNCSHTDLVANPEGFVHRVAVDETATGYRAAAGIYSANARM